MVYAWLEGGVVILSLAVTFFVGLHFSKDGRTSLKEYMLGSRKMHPLPISLSIAATYLTGTSMMSNSQEVYMFGMLASLAAVFYAMNGLAVAYVYLPVSYSIKSASSFEYFDRRFNHRIRKFASIMYALEMLHHTAMSQLVPALALSQASGLPDFPIACALSIICSIYTASGGLKAVAWADGIQAIIFLSCIMVLFVTGIVFVGGPMEVWQRGLEGSRVEFFDFDPSMEVRYSTIVTTFGCLILTPALYLSPSFHQRIAAMPTFKRAQQVTIWSSLFAGVFFAFSYTMGLVIYAYFAGCDPVLAKKDIASYHRILPYFVNQIADKFPGLLGLFLSGVIAAGLSTTTSCWNTVACTFYEDLVRPFLKPEIPKRTSFRILNAIVVVVAVVSTAIIPLIRDMKSLIEATLAIKSLTLVMSLVLYNTGMFIPWVNSMGVFVGSVCSAVVTFNVVIGNQRAKSMNLLVDVPKILTTSQCLVNGTTMEALNMTTSIGTEGFGLVTLADLSVPWYHKLSMICYTAPGLAVGFVAAILVSALTGFQDVATVDREMIVPQMRWALPLKPRPSDNDGMLEEGTPMTEYNLIAGSEQAVQSFNHK